jgi:hypothetical protein
MVFDLAQPELEPKIYRSRCEHTNQYITDSVPSIVTLEHLLAYKSNITGCDKRVISIQVVTTKLMV